MQVYGFAVDEKNAMFSVKHNYISFRDRGYMFRINYLIHHQVLYKINSKNKTMTCNASTPVACCVLSCDIPHYN